MSELREEVGGSGGNPTRKAQEIPNSESRCVSAVVRASVGRCHSSSGAAVGDTPGSKDTAAQLASHSL